MNTQTKVCAFLLGLTLMTGHAVAGGFKDADKNGDGGLNIEELKAAHMDDMVKNFKSLDIDKDGKISKDEAKANR